MDYKKTNAPLSTTVHDLVELAEQTGNIYETVSIISKRANQIAKDMKDDLDKKLSEFTSPSDDLNEISENREQIEISRFYEKLPKPTLIATQEYMEGKLYFKNATKDREEM
ncbi:MAG: DNA-directed RNA polymerase subunit omega, partial [Muribaculaceae bacterium]|nr:DNA-directed RNA polymerase subunit omega [Muribaculaceae bacterium]